ncbi:flagellar motor switch phosphatase FliY [Rossellomorea vietnamensis]|uniref:Flagellar motor switch phosphatase FliY n=1 Tax=Rossellomorea vietnamensis TaxID=218284 RepID=A0A5D4NRK4_9BACI|nr:flagellar motor switch phosphatase FliY [Rossellomorea vietnamensis]TYS16274.1 flagellar motor switch phosphatase FliY [Rossellomorea vietnamensis]
MMSDDMLSQDEIDALLRGTASEEKEPASSQKLNVEEYLSEFEQDALGEIGNISFGSSATALSTLLNQKVEITTPKVSILERSRLEDDFPHPYVAIQVQYTEGFSGANLLVIKQEDAAIIADLMLGGDGLSPSADLGEIQVSAVQEAMNQMMGSAATSMSTVFSKRVDISPPTVDMMYLPKGEGAENIPEQDLLTKISFTLKVGNLIDSNIMQLLPLPFAKQLVEELTNNSDTSSTNSDIMEQGNAEQNNTNPNVEPQMATSYSQPDPFNETPVYQAPERTQPQHFGGSQMNEQPVNVQPASFSSFDQAPVHKSESKNLDMLLDIPLNVTVELGRTNRSVKDILELSSGSIIELDKLAGEPVDVLVNSRLIAKGEVVVIDENFGVRITDIVSQSDRLKKLK